MRRRQQIQIEQGNFIGGGIMQRRYKPRIFGNVETCFVEALPHIRFVGHLRQYPGTDQAVIASTGPAV